MAAAPSVDAAPGEEERLALREVLPLVPPLVPKELPPAPPVPPAPLAPPAMTPTRLPGWFPTFFYFIYPPPPLHLGFMSYDCLYW